MHKHDNIVCVRAHTHTHTHMYTARKNTDLRLDLKHFDINSLPTSYTAYKVYNFRLNQSRVIIKFLYKDTTR